jgi:hypothetical protein
MAQRMTSVKPDTAVTSTPSEDSSERDGGVNEVGSPSGNALYNETLEISLPAQRDGGFSLVREKPTESEPARASKLDRLYNR